MSGKPATHQPENYSETISREGYRLTKQRQTVYDVLVGRRDHPTATEVFLRVKESMPAISLATVYNCLETLTQCGLVRSVNLERGPSRYCPNLEVHGHFFCESCGKVIDVDIQAPEEHARWQLPARCVVTHEEVTLRGTCPDCYPTPLKKDDKHKKSEKNTLPNAQHSSRHARTHH